MTTIKFTIAVTSIEEAERYNKEEQSENFKVMLLFWFSTRVTRSWMSLTVLICDFDYIITFEKCDWESPWNMKIVCVYMK